MARSSGFCSAFTPSTSSLTLVLAILLLTPHGNSGRRFSDVEDNAIYWDFVVLSWVIIYAVLYWAPRLVTA